MYLGIDKRIPEKIAIIENDGKKCTYGELSAFPKEFINVIGNRELIFILCKNSIGALAAHIACVEEKIVPLMISSKMDHELLDNLLSIYMPAYLWVPKEDVESLLDYYDYKEIYEKYDYSLLKTGNETAKLYDDLAMLLTTSGSTGSPKLVRHCYKNLYENAKNVANFFGFNENEHAWIDLQLHYTMGLNVACSNLFAGATLYMTTYTMMDKRYWDFYNKSNITNMTGVPYNYEMLKRLKFFKQEHPSLKIMAEGGGRLTDELFTLCAEYAKEKNIKFFATFGTSETTARLAYLEPQMAIKKIGSIGKAIPNGELFLLNDTGESIDEAEAIGELAYRGPNVTLGYALKKEDLLLGDERKGIYKTGDIAKRDSEGYYYILGRKGRFLKLFGYRVGLDECERLIKDRFNIECACAGNDQQMDIFITFEGMEQEIRKYISEKTRIQINAFAVNVISELPRNEVGKILYKDLKVEKTDIR